MPPPSSAAARRATYSAPAPRWWPRPTPAARSRSRPTPSGSATRCRCCTRWSCSTNRSWEEEMATASGVEGNATNEVLSEDALEFVAELHRRFDGRRRELLERREQRQRELDEGGSLDFLAETRE